MASFSLKTVDEISSELNNIKDSYGYTGQVWEMLIPLLAQSIYLNESLALNLLYESSLTRSSSINSKITRACDYGYSVFRGKNERITFKSLGYLGTSVTSMSRLDPLFEHDGYTFYLDDDYTFVPVNQMADAVTDVRCLIGNSVLTASERVTVKNRMVVYFPKNNISEDIEVYVNGQKVKVSNSLRQDDASEANKVPFVSVLTMAGFGVMVVNHQVNNSFAFNVGDTVSIKYVEYVGENANLETLKAIPYFEPSVVGNSTSMADEESTYGENNILFSVVGYKEPNLVAGDIYLGAINAMHKNDVIETNDGLKNIIQEYFSDWISAINLRKSFVDEWSCGVLTPGKETAGVKVVVEENIKDNISAYANILSRSNHQYDDAYSYQYLNKKVERVNWLDSTFIAAIVANEEGETINCYCWTEDMLKYEEGNNIFFPTKDGVTPSISLEEVTTGSSGVGTTGSSEEDTTEDDTKGFSISNVPYLYFKPFISSTSKITCDVYSVSYGERVEAYIYVPNSVSLDEYSPLKKIADSFDAYGLSYNLPVYIEAVIEVETEVEEGTEVEGVTEVEEGTEDEDGTENDDGMVISIPTGIKTYAIAPDGQKPCLVSEIRKTDNAIFVTLNKTYTLPLLNHGSNYPGKNIADCLPYLSYFDTNETGIADWILSQEQASVKLYEFKQFVFYMIGGDKDSVPITNGKSDWSGCELYDYISNSLTETSYSSIDVYGWSILSAKDRVWFDTFVKTNFCSEKIETTKVEVPVEDAEPSYVLKKRWVFDSAKFNNYFGSTGDETIEDLATFSSLQSFVIKFYNAYDSLSTLRSIKVTNGSEEKETIPSNDFKNITYFFKSFYNWKNLESVVEVFYLSYFAMINNGETVDNTSLFPSVLSSLSYVIDNIATGDGYYERGVRPKAEGLYVTGAGSDDSSTVTGGDRVVVADFLDSVMFGINKRGRDSDSVTDLTPVEYCLRNLQFDEARQYWFNGNTSGIFCKLSDIISTISWYGFKPTDFDSSIAGGGSVIVNNFKTYNVLSPYRVQYLSKENLTNSPFAFRKRWYNIGEIDKNESFDITYRFVSGANYINSTAMFNIEPQFSSLTEGEGSEEKTTKLSRYPFTILGPISSSLSYTGAVSFYEVFDSNGKYVDDESYLELAIYERNIKLSIYSLNKYQSPYFMGTTSHVVNYPVIMDNGIIEASFVPKVQSVDLYFVPENFFVNNSGQSSSESDSATVYPGFVGKKGTSSYQIGFGLIPNDEWDDHPIRMYNQKENKWEDLERVDGTEISAITKTFNPNTRFVFDPGNGEDKELFEGCLKITLPIDDESSTQKIQIPLFEANHTVAGDVGLFYVETSENGDTDYKRFTSGVGYVEYKPYVKYSDNNVFYYNEDGTTSMASDFFHPFSRESAIEDMYRLAITYKNDNLLVLNIFYLLAEEMSVDPFSLFNSASEGEEPQGDYTTKYKPTFVSFINTMKNVYYINNTKYNFSKAVPKGIIDTTSHNLSDTKNIPISRYYLDGTIYTNPSITQSLIAYNVEQLVNTYKNRLGEPFNLYELIADIQKSVDGVEFVSLSDSMAGRGVSFTLEENEYMNFDIGFKYDVSPKYKGGF